MLLIYIYSGFSLSTHIAGPSCARLIWSGATVVCSILHNPPTRRVGGAFCTTTICGVFPWWSRRRSRLALRFCRERARCCCCLFSWSSTFCTSGRALHSADCGCAESRHPRLRLPGVEVVLVVTGSPVSEVSARSRSLTLSGISTRPWFAAVTPSSVGVTSHEPTSRSSVEAESSPSPSRPARTTTPPGRQTRRSMGRSCTRHAPGARRFADRHLRAEGPPATQARRTGSSRSVVNAGIRGSVEKVVVGVR